MLPEKNAHTDDCDALAARLSQLAPADARSVQSQVFYEAGYRAGLEQQRVTSTKRHLFLAAACLLISVGAGVLSARLPFVRESLNVVQANPNRSVPQPVADSSEDAASEPSELGAAGAPVPQGDRPLAKLVSSPPVPFVAKAFAKYVTTWSQRNAVSSGIKIGPIGSSWDDLVVAQIPPHGLSAEQPSNNEPLLTENALYHPFDLNRFRQILRN